jgi:hypothetical protein
MIALSLLVGLVVYILFGWFAVQLVGKLANIVAFTSVTKKALQVLWAIVLILFPTWDMVPSRLYFQHLCDQEAGVKVLKRVHLDPSYFRSDGKPDDKKLTELYALSISRDPSFSSWTHITKQTGTIQDKQSGELLGTSVDFAHYGGWLASRLAPMSADTCPAYRGDIFGIALEEVFKPKLLSS